MPQLAFATDRQLRSAKPTSTDYRIGCGFQLYLRITPTGFKYWQTRFYKPNGKESLLQFASYPQTSLLDARAQLALLLPGLLAGRLSPTAVAKQTERSALSFDECAARYIEAKRHEWKNAKHTQQWKNTLSQHASLVFGCLEPIWPTRNETASWLRGRIESVVDWAKAKSLFVGGNPAAWKGRLQNLLAAQSEAQKVMHHPSMRYQQLPAFYRQLQSMPGVGAVALQFLILTACRTNEILGARWSEISEPSRMASRQDNHAVWTIPQERMKAGREHRVPLSGPAVQLVNSCRRAGPYVFSNTVDGEKAMSNMALAMLLRRAVTDPTADPITVHGFRATFRNWAAEQTTYAREVCEHALAHQLPDKVEAAYARSDLLDKRRGLMRDWAEYCLGHCKAGAL